MSSKCGRQISTFISHVNYAKLMKFAQSQNYGTTVSSVVREIINQFLDGIEIKPEPAPENTP